MGGILDDELGEDYVEEPKGMTFDEMVAFTMFAEVSLVLATAAVYLIVVYLAVR